jgi:hypothetical protein
LLGVDDYRNLHAGLRRAIANVTKAVLQAADRRVLA